MNESWTVVDKIKQLIVSVSLFSLVIYSDSAMALSLENDHSVHTKTQTDLFWISLCAALVLLMQAGFTCLEAGLVRHKNSINVAAKNLMDFCVSGAVFWLLGFTLMFGQSWQGWIGLQGISISSHQQSYYYAFLLFQLMFCGTATTIISGAVAERMSFMGYMIVAVLVSGIIYPIAGHWAWNGLFEGQSSGWLAQAGFIDFAGSSVVHSVGGWCALAAVLIIGPRIGRFEHNQGIPASSLPLAVLGAMFLWFGWFGFNGGSTLAASNDIPLILINSFLAAVFGGLFAAAICYLRNRKIHITSCINGVLGGLVAVTASCNIIQPSAAVLLGSVSGVLICVTERFMCSKRIDDVVGAVPVHLLCGIWGTLAIPFLSSPDLWGTGLSVWQQFLVQLQGVAVIGLFSFASSYTLLRCINMFYSLRVSPRAEQLGLNIVEHNASNEIYELLKQMQFQEKQGDFSTKVSEEPFTEAGQIAHQYNNILDRVNHEIFSREQALENFKQSESRKGAILNAALDCIVTIDTDGNIQEFNLAAEKCFGLGANRVLKHNFVDMFVPENARSNFLDSLGTHFSISSELALNRHNRITLQRIPGDEFPAELSITQVELGESKLIKEYTFHIRDISRQVEMHDKMQTLAFNDVLTGLYNRYFFKERLIQEIDFASRHRSNVLIMFLDLDQFKNINDTLGHEAGDRLLCHVADLLTQSLRAEDIVSRWGGDEFIILFTGLTSKQAASKAEEIIEILRTPITIEGRELFAQTSIGIAESNDGRISAENLIQRADMAMYEAKQNGRNTYCFFLPEMEEKVSHRFFYENELKNALKNDEFLIHYQPKVSCDSGEVVGFEALIRWMHPEKGLIPPGIFIPILEESSLINDVTNWVVDHVCLQLHTWKAKQLPMLPVAINLSVKDFMLDDCYDRIRGALLKYQVPGKAIELEITETMLATNTDKCINLMHKLKKMDISFSVDDFGTGYSSMSYLKKFPLDTLKIDRAFVSECNIDHEGGAICQAIVALGKSLGLKIIAEGVETDDQLAFIKETECDVYQGFLFSRPLPVDEAERLLADQSQIVSIRETIKDDRKIMRQ